MEKGKKMEITCGMCKHWQQSQGYNFGTCTVPLPFWIRESGMKQYSNIYYALPNDSTNDCHAFELKE